MRRGIIAGTLLMIFLVLFFLGFVLGADAYEAGGDSKPFVDAIGENMTRTGFEYMASQHDDRVTSITNKTAGAMFVLSPDFVGWGYDSGYDLHPPALPAAIIGLLLVLLFMGGLRIILIPVALLVIAYNKVRK